MNADMSLAAGPRTRATRTLTTSRQRRRLVCASVVAVLLAWSSTRVTVRAQQPAGPRPITKFVGNVSGSEVRSDFATYWNQITPENAGKWASVEATRDEMDWTGLDAAVQYAREHGMPFKQHTFVWGNQAPAWITQLPKKEQAAEVEEWIAAYCERYPDTAMIDVVNEPLHAPPAYAEALGGAGRSGYDWVIWAFRTARRHCPHAQLILNDFDVLRFDTQKFLDVANEVKRARLLDAIGAQAHGIETEPLDELRDNLKALASLRVPIYISEYDIDEYDDDRQKAVMAEQFPVFWESPAVAGITFWGYVYGSTWKKQAGLLRDGVPRPALTWLMEYLHR